MRSTHRYLHGTNFSVVLFHVQLNSAKMLHKFDDVHIRLVQKNLATILKQVSYAINTSHDSPMKSKEASPQSISSSSWWTERLSMFVYRSSSDELFKIRCWSRSRNGTSLHKQFILCFKRERIHTMCGPTENPLSPEKKGTRGSVNIGLTNTRAGPWRIKSGFYRQTRAR